MNVIRFDASQCERIRRQLDAYLSNELLVETTSDVLKHLECCEDCSNELESRTRLMKALQRAVAAQLPPDPLREEIHRRLREAQPGFGGGSRARTWTLALAAMILLMVAAAAGHHWLRLRRGRQMVASVLTLGVSDHLHCAIRHHNYPETANPPDQLRRKLGPKYASLLPVVEAKLPGFQVLEAHICSVARSPRKYVHFIARGRGTIVSVILTKREGEVLPGEKSLVAETSGGLNLFSASLEGMEAAGFETSEYFGFVVSDLGQRQVLQIATRLAPAIRNALQVRAGTEKFEAPALQLGTLFAGPASGFARYLEPGGFGNADFSH